MQLLGSLSAQAVTSAPMALLPFDFLRALRNMLISHVRSGARVKWVVCRSSNILHVGSAVRVN